MPSDDGSRFPSLGKQVVAWMQEHLVFGPGDLRGEPLRLDAEQQAFIWRFYELFPQSHLKAGRRRFQRCALSLAKGLRKTELAACVAAAELHPDAPVRFNGWRGRGLATGKGVTDPFVILVAYTEEQSNELAYGALKAILEESPIAKDFDIGLERIMRVKSPGTAVSLSGSPNARDGARTTFQCFDETHRMDTTRLKSSYQTMQANLPKRPRADPWQLEITTASEPGSGSIAEGTMDYALAVRDGRVTDSSLFFYHRQASDSHDLKTPEGLRAAVIEASGEAASWRDIDRIVTEFSNPTTDRAYWERVWLNRIVKGSLQAFDVSLWQQRTTAHTVPKGALITLGFDGSLFHDATALVPTEVATGYQWVAGLWECPPGKQAWQVPSAEVDALVRQLFSEYTVWRMYCDPPYWESWIALWQGVFGKERVIEWWTNRRRQMAAALLNFDTAIRDGSISHDGDKRYERHIANARRDDQKGTLRDERGKPLWLIHKERPDSPQKMDLAMAGALSWEARTDAIAAGATREPEFQIMAFGR